VKPPYAASTANRQKRGALAAEGRDAVGYRAAWQGVLATESWGYRGEGEALALARRGALQVLRKARMQ